MGRILADSIKNVDHIGAFDDMLADRWEKLDVTPVIVNLVDLVPAVGLPYLAQQWDVLGIKGYTAADTEEKKRALIKKAIELHRYQGTIYSIEEALKTIGIFHVKIIENLAIYFYDGVFLADGTICGWGAGWGTFIVILDISEFTSITADLVAKIKALINVYKNKRSHLIELSFSLSFEEIIEPIESFIDNNFNVVDRVETGYYYDGVITADGTRFCANIQEVFEMTIIG